MGEMADYYMREMMCEDYYDYHDPSFFSEEESEIILNKHKEGTLFWTTREGKDINVKDMTVSHIENTIRFIVNKSDDLTGSSKSWVEVLTEELNRRDNG